MKNGKIKSDKLPPHSDECEAGLLSCALAQPDLLDEITAVPSDLYDLRHGEIFRALIHLRKINQPIDLITVQQFLKDQKRLKECGGITYLLEIQDASPSPANWISYQEKVLEKSELRKIIKTCSGIVSQIYDYEGDIDELKFSVQSDLGEVFGVKNERPKIITAREFMASDLSSPPQIIHGILHAGSKMAVGGASKSFKTWTLLDLAISVSTGCDWLKFQTTQGKVLFLNFEIQEYSWQTRIRKIAEAKQIELNSDLHLWNLRGHAEDFRALIPKIIQRARENYSLIILDPIYKIYGNTDENSARDTAALLNSLENLANQSGAAIAFAAHFAKGNASSKNAIDRISGSGVFARDPDSILVFTEHESESAFTIEPILRNFPHHPSFAVRWTFPLMSVVADLDPSKLKQAGGKKPDFASDDILKLLPDDGCENKEWLRVAGESGISQATFYRLRRMLVSNGKVIESKVNGKWVKVLSKIITSENS